MTRTSNRWPSLDTTLFNFPVIFCLVFAFSLTEGIAQPPENVSDVVPTFAIATKDEFNLPPGADPKVTAENGGAGFEKIAVEEGWKTGSLSDEDFLLLRDPRAIKGGEMKMLVNDYPATFRSHGKDENVAVTRLIESVVYEGLIRLNPMTLEFIPVLASHWKIDPDGQTYWFRIDPNARFSDGARVTTSDVLATYDLAVDEGILSPSTNIFYEGYDRPDSVSMYIFKVHSRNEGWGNFGDFAVRSILPAHVIGHISGNEYLTQFQYRMVPGTGPYIIQTKDVINQKQVSITRRTNYWAENYPQNRGSNNFDRISLIVVEDERLQLEKFKAGEVDLYLIARAQWYEEELGFDEVKRGLIQVRRIYNDEPQGVSGLVFNMRRPPFNNPKVREAFTYLFNREDLVKNLMYNQYTLTDSYYPGSIYENPNNPKIRYNPERGAQLLAEAGYTTRNQEGLLVNNETGKPLLIAMPITDSWVRVMTPVQEEWKKLGIELRFGKVDGTTQFKLLNERKFHIAFMAWGGSLFPHPIYEYHSMLADVPETNNLGGFKNERADQIMEQELLEFDQQKRIVLLRELDSILMASHSYALAWYAPFTRVAYWNKFGHPEFYIGKTADWRYIMTNWWVSPEKSKKLAEAMEDKSIDLGEGDRDVHFWPEYNRTHPSEFEE